MCLFNIKENKFQGERSNNGSLNINFYLNKFLEWDIKSFFEFSYYLFKKIIENSCWNLYNEVFKMSLVYGV